MTDAVLYRTPISSAWIDYNGHLRDAYYSLIVSLAADALMDRIGLDEAYRSRTHCTLYTLEMHLHFLHEVKQSDTVEVGVRILGVDRKRIHAAFDLRVQRFSDPVASAELMLLHVHQGEKPGAAPFPPDVAAALGVLATATPAATDVPGSRRIELRSRP